MGKAWDVAMRMIQARQTAKVLARELVKPVEVKVLPRVEIRPTHVVDLRDVPVTRHKSVIDERGQGVVQEFMVKSPSPEFGIRAWVDNELVTRSYAEVSEITQEVKHVAAFQNEEGLYVLHLTDLEFAERISLALTVKVPITFNSVYAKYKLSPPIS